ncbi:hypothetical protein T4D_15682 [Trichinella pseudospiralis]|uniref:Uncharacterized protein n=1 Tax=Trichinella pseudospiralis TaxID=6337 RepID=A0A0V1FBV5_TRIPS|nr:hypothetical protein T4D_15682 [Trichinella pseudospiralis]
MPMEKTLSALAPKIQKIYKHILCQLLQSMVQLYSNAKINALTNVVNITRETKRLALMLYLEEQLVSILLCQRNLITSVIILHEMETSAAMKELVERDWKLKEEVSFAVSLPNAPAINLKAELIFCYQAWNNKQQMFRFDNNSSDAGTSSAIPHATKSVGKTCRLKHRVRCPGQYWKRKKLRSEVKCQIRCLREKLLPKKHDFEIICYCIMAKQHFPTLHGLALQLLYMPSGTCDDEFIHSHQLQSAKSRMKQRCACTTFYTQREMFERKRQKIYFPLSRCWGSQFIMEPRQSR